MQTTPAPAKHVPSRLNGVDRVLASIEDAMNLFAAGSIFVLMFLAAIQVISRKVFNVPIPAISTLPNNP